MFYKIRSSVDRKVIGTYPQATSANHRVRVDHPQHSNTIYLKKVKPEDVITPSPILEKKAILTDLMVGSVAGISWKLMISDKFKQLLESAHNPGVQFFPMSVIYKGIELKNYWMANPFAFDNQFINYPKSKTVVVGFGGIFLKEIEIHDFEEYSRLVKSNSGDEAVTIKEVVLNKGISQDLLILYNIPGAVGYYVSEKLKYEIEEAGCTGIEFDPVAVV